MALAAWNADDSAFLPQKYFCTFQQSVIIVYVILFL
jgi:hypothetical protein